MELDGIYNDVRLLTCLGGLSAIIMMELIPNRRSDVPTSVHVWPGCMRTFLPCFRSVLSTLTYAMKHFGFFVFLLKGYNPTTLSSLTEYTIVFSSPCPGDRTSTRGKVFPVHAASSISGLGIRSLKTAEGVAFVARSSGMSSSEDDSVDSWVGTADFTGGGAGAGCCLALIFDALWRFGRGLPWRFLLRACSGLAVWPSITWDYGRKVFSIYFLKVLIDEGINNVNPVSVLCWSILTGDSPCF